ncbi:ST3A1 sulfotransferase, partial [Callaeas wilsoni]|nr:ST3A1 sulfotransferase [Callaeas wilsoni]
MSALGRDLAPGGFWGPHAQPPRPQVIYTVRDPKDVLVSLFHFSRIFRPYKDPGTLEEFMEKFLEGD